MTVKQTLVAAKAVLVTHGWTKGAFARNELSESVDILDPSAKCFCSIGAIYKVCGLEADYVGEPNDGTLAIRRFREAAKCFSIGLWNDLPNRTLPEVLAAFDKAIESAE